MRIETRRVHDVLIIEMIGRLDSVSAGDAEDHDQIQAYEMVDGQAVAASDLLFLPGPVTALWPSETPGQSTVVIRNSKTGNYEASRLGVACTE